MGGGGGRSDHDFLTNWPYPDVMVIVKKFLRRKSKQSVSL